MYIKFVECQNDGRKTKVFMVRNSSGDDLGAISFKSQWRRYVFVTPPTVSVFDANCLGEIIAFLNSENEKRNVTHGS